MKKLNTKLILTLSIAIFSMFFGAGNTIYPIALAIEAKSRFSWAFFGFIFTAILGPLLGLVGGALCQGKSKRFFFAAGKYPGSVLLAASLALLGPLAVLPRCVSVSFAAVQTLLPGCSLLLFSFLFCGLALLCLFRKQMILKILGYVLSPALLSCLGIIIFKGFLSLHALPISSLGVGESFSYGLVTGYQTMDLIASIIFSAGIWSMVSDALSSDSKELLKGTLITGGIACLLLGLIYFGLGHAALLHIGVLKGLPKQDLLPALAQATLGSSSALLVNILIALACFTTVIGLTMTIANILSKEFAKNKLSYRQGATALLLLTFIMTQVGFETISVMIIKVLTYLYPLIILLTLFNIVRNLRLDTQKNRQNRVLQAKKE